MTINPNPDFATFQARLSEIGKSFDRVLDQDVFRFINPKFSNAPDIVSGAGTLYASGRWLAVGTTRLSYSALSPETALAEVLAHVRYYNLPLSKALPSVLVNLHLKVSRVLDLREKQVQQALGLSLRDMRDVDWRLENQAEREAVTQAWGKAFSAALLEAVIVPSAADPHGANVLIFPDHLRRESKFEVIDEVVWN
jgi:RES domain-containing protein